MDAGTIVLDIKILRIFRHSSHRLSQGRTRYDLSQKTLRMYISSRFCGQVPSVPNSTPSLLRLFRASRDASDGHTGILSCNISPHFNSPCPPNLLKYHMNHYAIEPRICIEFMDGRHQGWDLDQMRRLAAVDSTEY